MSKTGGPAYPTMGNVGYKSEWQTEDGMSLLDYFAGQVIAGAWAKRGTSDLWPNLLAEYAYEVAEAMIAEKAKREASRE